jgi:FkbM family methyltransferase
MYNRAKRILKGTEEKRFFCSLDLNGKVVYDIGAWTGKGTTLLFSSLVGETGLVYAFEPTKSSFSELIQNTKSRRNVVCFQVGLGSKNERKELFIPFKEQGRASMDKKIQESFRSKEICEVVWTAVYTLDSFIKYHNLRVPNFVKIDTEGMEAEILLGMVDTIQTYYPSLLIEFHGISKEEKLTNAHKISDFLLLMNYHLYHIETKKNVTYILNSYDGHVFAYKQKCMVWGARAK